MIIQFQAKFMVLVTVVYHLILKYFASFMYLSLPQVFDKHIWGIDTKIACLYAENIAILANVLISGFI